MIISHLQVALLCSILARRLMQKKMKMAANYIKNRLVVHKANRFLKTESSSALCQYLKKQNPQMMMSPQFIKFKKPQTLKQH
nr:hypothetical protein Iba_chr14fCG11760 [Ipomoea batatas]